MKLQRQGKIYTSEEQLGYDMEKLIRQFSGDPRFINMASYKDMVRMFSGLFVDNDGKAELNPHPDGKILLNPSDSETEIGHKGVGYQVQIAETCSDKNEVQLITAALPQGGSESDMESLPKIEEKLKKEEHLPEELFADAGYGSDENYVKSAENGVKLIAPTAHQPKDKVGLNKCKFDEKKVYCGMSCRKKNLLPEVQKRERTRRFFQQRLR